MAIATSTAILASAAASAGASLYGASQASKAAQNATNTNTALIQANQQRADQYLSPYVQAGGSALSPLQALITGSGYAQQATQASQGPQYDIAAYLAANPDVEAARADLMAQGVIGPGKQWNTFEDWVANMQLPGAIAKGEQRQYPTIAKPDATSTEDGGGQTTYGPQVGERPTFVRPDAGSAPTQASFFDRSNFQTDPGYEFAVQEALRAVNTKAGASGKYFSGARDMALQDRATNLANQQYGNWWNRQNALYGQALGQFNTDRNVLNQNFDLDRAQATGTYESDRAYNTNRFDTQVSNLFNLAGMGQNAASSAVNAGTNTTNALTGQNNALASVQGNAAIAGANGVNSAIGNALTAYGMFNRGSTNSPLYTGTTNTTYNTGINNGGGYYGLNPYWT